MADWDGGLTTYAYDAAGQLITTTLPNGVVSVNLYDDAGRLIQIEHRDGLGGLLARYEYELDGGNQWLLGNRVSAVETLTGTRTIAYVYDPLNRLTGSTCSTGEQFAYTYDAAGNRAVVTETTPISGTVVTTYTFDAANRLTDRRMNNGWVYTYTWSNRGQMLEEWTQGQPVRTFEYNAAGQMSEATVFTLTTRFRYNGDGARLAVEVVGQGTTTYTIDYAGGYRVLAEETLTETVSYLYGHDCLGEQRDDEWLYYLNDAAGYVRQGADEQGQVASAWLFDPDGLVIEGPEGPVSHLVCGGVYDWSTGLLFKGNRYFDPTLGIWLSLTPLVVLQGGKGRKKRRWWVVMLVILAGIGGIMVGCKPPTGTTQTVSTETCTATATETPGPTNTPPATPTWTVTLTVTWTPFPTLPPTYTPTPAPPIPTETLQPTPTNTPQPTPTPTVPPTYTPPTDKIISDREERKRIVKQAAEQYRDPTKYSLALLLGIISWESEGSFSNDVQTGGMMGITTSVWDCYGKDGYKKDEVPVYTNTRDSLYQNVEHGACHFQGYAWNRTFWVDENSKDLNEAIMNAVQEAGFPDDMMWRRVAAAQWYAGKQADARGYLYSLASVIEGVGLAEPDQGYKGIPQNFGLSDSELVRALRAGYSARILLS